MERPGTIEHRHELSVEAFLSDYVAENRPVIVTDAMDTWNALHTWTPEAFVIEFGGLDVDVYGDFFDVVTTMKLARFYEEYLQYPRHRMGGYVRWFAQLREGGGPWADEVFTRLAGDWSLPYFLPATGYVVPAAPAPRQISPTTDGFPYRGFFISGPGARTRLHRDPWTSSAVLCQVYGRKEYLFFAPEGAEHLMRRTRYVDPENVDRDAFPTYDRTQAAYEGTLRRGDVLFIPRGWFHDVTTCSNSISVTWNFVHELQRRPFDRYLADHPFDNELDVAHFFAERVPEAR